MRRVLRAAAGRPSAGGGRSVAHVDCVHHPGAANGDLGPAIWPPLEERKLDFNGVLAELMPLLGCRVRVEIGGIGEHTRAVICGELAAVGDATGVYASFVVGDAALTLKEPEFVHGLLSVMEDEGGEKLHTVYLVTRNGGTISICRDALVTPLA
jgi:hypothetical protein